MDEQIAAFLKFFEGEFQRELDTVEIPGMPSASWDRKAAWLLWCACTSAPINTTSTFPALKQPVHKMPWEE